MTKALIAPVRFCAKVFRLFGASRSLPTTQSWCLLLAGLCGLGLALGCGGCENISPVQLPAPAADGGYQEVQPPLRDAGTDAGPAEDGGADAGADAGNDGGGLAVGCAYLCHGDETSAAPPVDLQGKSATDRIGVGAHRAHLAGDTGWHRAVVCEDCHLVPTEVADPGHLDTLRPAELTFGSVGLADGATPNWNGITCSGVYCHGATLLPGGTLSSPSWTTLDGSQAACGSCHGLPPDPPHPAVHGNDCGGCHPFSGLTPDEPARHIDGVVDLSPCGSCHPIPPDSGAHKLHYDDAAVPPEAAYGDLRILEDYDPAGGSRYRFGCGNCHPIDGAKHMDGTLEVELHDPAAPPGSLKARAGAGASYSGGVCREVACHSNGTATPTFTDSPPWTGTFSGKRCAGCHQDPPSYPSGGAGTASANSHLVLAEDGYEFGHFGGLPGPWHTSHHGDGGLSAAPITCQTCHYESVDPGNVGPGGVFYLDTEGNYDLGGSLGYQCTNCHDGNPGSPASGGGAVLPLRHVNGRVDVTFDAREALPPGTSGVPSGADAPLYPYWVDILPLGALPAGSAKSGAVWSLTLSGASYEATTKTCSNVPCHLSQSYPGGLPLIWGESPVGWATCNNCHQF